jgi:hypothetical protein
LFLETGCFSFSQLTSAPEIALFTNILKRTIERILACFA